MGACRPKCKTFLFPFGFPSAIRAIVIVNNYYSNDCDNVTNDKPPLLPGDRYRENHLPAFLFVRYFDNLVRGCSIAR